MAWMTVCRRQSRCRWCKDTLSKGDPVVAENLRLESRNWTTRYYWHPQCWIDQGLHAIRHKLRGEVTTPSTRGRKAIDISQDQRVERNKILRRHAALVCRIKSEMSKGSGTLSVDRMIHFGGMLNEMKEEISKLGGVPKSWED